MSAQTNPERRGRDYEAVRRLILSGRPLLYLVSSEEGRVRRILGELGGALPGGEHPLWIWSLTAGLRKPGDKSAVPEALGPRQVLDYIARAAGPAIFLLQDFHEFLRDSTEVRRGLRDLYELCLDRSKFVVINSQVAAVPLELSRQVALVELGQPDLDELTAFLRDEARALREKGVSFDADEGMLFRVARALQGLTLEESRHAIRRALAGHGALDEEAVPLLLEEKRDLINRSGLVQFVSDGTRLDHVGGLENLKQWLEERKKLFVERESVAAEIVPKGVLIMGVSGCGKSLSVKAIASSFGLPLYRIDMIEVFSGNHGNADRAFAEACRIVESMAPAVVWFDEIEMGLTAQTGEATSDLMRIFAFFLTWMQEKTRGLFVAATANRIDLLPAEMIRKGRFDEVFFIDLPGEKERQEIFRIHLEKRGVDPESMQVERLIRITQEWTGAEIEQCVVSALTLARLRDRRPQFDDLLTATQDVVPLSKTMREQVDHIRSWAFDRAVRASARD